MRLSPVTMTVRMPMRRSAANRSRMPGLTMSFSSITPSSAAVGGDRERRAAGARDAVDRGGEGCAAARSRRSRASTLSTAPLRQELPAGIEAGEAGVGA